MDAPLIRTLCANSVEEFNLAVQSFAWDIEFVQIDRGARPVQANACASPSVALLQVELGNHVHQQGSPPPGLLTFGMPAQPQESLRFGSREVTTESILAFSNSIGFDAVAAGGFKAYTLSFTPEQLTASARILGQREAEDMSVNQGAVRYPDPRRLRDLRRALAVLFDEAFRLRASPAMPTLTATIESELPLMFLQAWNQCSLSDGVPARPRMQALSRARDYIEAHARDPITVPDVCRAASCSLSTLSRTFREHFGVSPKRYLTAVRLAGVRRSLMMGATRSVGDAAAEWGFWHLSKFTEDYKRMYGELPSATRSRAIGASN